MNNKNDCKYCYDIKDSIFPINKILFKEVYGKDVVEFSLRLNGDIQHHKLCFKSCVNNAITSVNMEINNCPMCGRKLVKGN